MGIKNSVRTDGHLQFRKREKRRTEGRTAVVRGEGEESSTEVEEEDEDEEEEEERRRRGGGEEEEEEEEAVAGRGVVRVL